MIRKLTKMKHVDLKSIYRHLSKISIEGVNYGINFIACC